MSKTYGERHDALFDKLTGEYPDLPGETIGRMTREQLKQQDAAEAAIGAEAFEASQAEAREAAAAKAAAEAAEAAEAHTAALERAKEPQQAPVARFEPSFDDIMARMDELGVSNTPAGVLQAEQSLRERPPFVAPKLVAGPEWGFDSDEPEDTRTLEEVQAAVAAEGARLSALDDPYTVGPSDQTPETETHREARESLEKAAANAGWRF